jgi:serine/threonine-protein kinase
MSLAPNAIVEGKYRIVQRIGEGGMGEVWLGENVRIGRRVALKLLRPEVAQSSVVLERFEREAQAAARIGSEHIVDVLDMGDLDTGERYIVMEYLDGESLAERMERLGTMPLRPLLAITLQLLEGLAVAHDAGIVHRDLKPENVFLARRTPRADRAGGGAVWGEAVEGAAPPGQAEVVKILDFGISKFGSAEREAGGSTTTGALMGTPAYMSPEQARGIGRNVDHRSDLFAVGVILYEATTGRLPYVGESINDLLFRIALEDPTPIEQHAPDLDPEFVAIVRRAMAREPDARFASAREMAAAIRAFRTRVFGPSGEHVPDFRVTMEPFVLGRRSRPERAPSLATAATQLQGGGRKRNDPDAKTRPAMERSTVARPMPRRIRVIAGACAVATSALLGAALGPALRGPVSSAGVQAPAFPTDLPTEAPRAVLRAPHAEAAAGMTRAGGERVASFAESLATPLSDDAAPAHELDRTSGLTSGVAAGVTSPARTHAASNRADAAHAVPTAPVVTSPPSSKRATPPAGATKAAARTSPTITIQGRRVRTEL